MKFLGPFKNILVDNYLDDGILLSRLVLQSRIVRNHVGQVVLPLKKVQLHFFDQDGLMDFVLVLVFWQTLIQVSE